MSTVVDYLPESGQGGDTGPGTGHGVRCGEGESNLSDIGYGDHGDLQWAGAVLEVVAWLSFV